MLQSRIKVGLIGGLAIVVVIVAIAFAAGGSSGHKSQHAAIPSVGAAHAASAGGTVASGGTTTSAGTGSSDSLGVAHGAMPSVAAPRSAAQSPLVSNASSQGASAVTATRIVKTGSLDLRVDKGAVQSTIGKLTHLTQSFGGYVARSTANTNSADPTGEVELKIPVAQFTSAVTAAEALGHVEALTTSAKDVTGKYVDLGAREHALERTRSTYLSILSRATTIGATLAVQQRIDDVQQQIDELHGEIKLLANQSAFSTLDVNVDQPTIAPPAKTHHQRHGLSAAWHRSIHRFDRGIDAIVGALGPLLLAVLLIAIAFGIVRVGMRGARRHRSSSAAG